MDKAIAGCSKCPEEKANSGTMNQRGDMACEEVWDAESS